jgi:chromosome condensin MukBEF ATPase and DNA-binding subunit MukB
MASTTENFQAKMESANERFNSLQRELSTYISARQQLEAQLQENKIVKEVRNHIFWNMSMALVDGRNFLSFQTILKSIN